MGWLEGVVVVYLRSMHPRLAGWKTIEISREAATLVMLITFALSAGGNRRERWGIFLWLFGIWDIVYYVCLWTCTGWPASLATMDTLFYIPCVWSAPVWVPVLFSLIMMLAGYCLAANRGADCLAESAWWALIGWLAGLLIGLANARLMELPHCVSAMGMSVCLGLIAFGAGLGYAISAKSAEGVPLRNLCVVIVCGIAGGLLGHLARSMFYASPHSFWWPAGAGLALGGVALILRKRKRNVSVP